MQTVTFWCVPVGLASAEARWWREAFSRRAFVLSCVSHVARGRLTSDVSCRVVAQVVPKAHVRSVKTLTKADEGLVRAMLERGREYLRSTLPADADASVVERYVFHVPPGNSIDHLHLHVLRPPFVSWHHGAFVYRPKVNMFCESVQTTLARLARL